MLAMY